MEKDDSTKQGIRKAIARFRKEVWFVPLSEEQIRSYQESRRKYWEAEKERGFDWSLGGTLVLCILAVIAANIFSKEQVLIYGISILVIFLFFLFAANIVAERLNSHIILEILKSTKFFTYITIAVSTIINVTSPSYHIEKGGLLTFFVVTVSLFEGITGFYEQILRSKSEN